MKGEENMHHCKILPPIVHPTKCCEHHTFSNTIVPHIHPQHTTSVNHQHYEHVHYFPHSYSNYDPVTEHHKYCGKPCC